MASSRKLDTRRKIIAGALVFSEANVDPDFAKDLCARFERRLAPKDRGIFVGVDAGLAWAVRRSAAPPADPLRPDTIREDTGRNLSHTR